MGLWARLEGKPDFVFEEEKEKLINHLDFMTNMDAKEITLYKKWKELNVPKMINDKSLMFDYMNDIWEPTDIFNKELTVKELTELEPYVEIITKETSTDWINFRRLTSTFNYISSPGRSVKANVRDRKTGKILGQIAYSSDAVGMAAREKFIGWTAEDRNIHKMLNHTTLCSSIVPSQPFGFNFLGGKLIAGMATLNELRNEWEKTYGDKLIAVGTTSLYGVHSMYNGLPYMKTLGESIGSVYTLPDDEYWKKWHKWLIEIDGEWYNSKILKKRQDDYTGESKAGYVSNFRQKIFDRILKHCEVKRENYKHGHRRGIFYGMIYENGKEFLRREFTDTSKLVMKKKYVEDMDHIMKWWRPKAINRYVKLHDEGKIKNEYLFYANDIGKPWEEFRNERLAEVGR